MSEFANPDIMAESTKALTNWLQKTGTADWKAAKDTFEQVAKVKKDAWTEMKDSFKEIGNLIDKGGFGSLIGDSLARLESQITNSLEAGFAPLTNMIAQAIDKVFDIPAVQNIMSGTTTLFHRGLMLLTGDMEGLRRELIAHQTEVERIRQETGASYRELEYARIWMETRGIDWQALNASGTAGGVYSGQFGYGELNIDLSGLDLSSLGTW